MRAGRVFLSSYWQGSESDNALAVAVKLGMESGAARVLRQRMTTLPLTMAAFREARERREAAEGGPQRWAGLRWTSSPPIA